jgi:hypothetical protein
MIEQTVDELDANRWHTAGVPGVGCSTGDDLPSQASG